MQHVQTAKKNNSRADLEQRLTGRYYTPTLIANHIARQAITVFPHPASIADPFCGDGRLIVTWLQLASQSSALHNLRRIILWDYDAAAVSAARERVKAELIALGLKNSVSIITETGDTFARTLSSRGGIDTILTNPPWELLKPDARDGLTDDGKFKEQLRNYASRLGRDFPGAVSAKGKAMTGYGVNLARAGAIASAMLIRPGGAIAIVLPSSIFADQASAPFRREFFTRLSVSRIDWYPAEARLFSGVDQPFVTAVAVAGSPTSSYLLNRFDSNLELIEQREVVVAEDLSKPLALNVTGEHESLVTWLSKAHAPLGLLEADMRYGLWLGREIDETRLSESLTTAQNGVPFLKGRQVFPFQVKQNEMWLVDPRKREIPDTVNQARLAWRDVSRPNQRRRMHVALVPKGTVTGNSLGVAFFRYATSDSIRVLMAVMNSLVFELQVRAYLATAHVSQGILRKCSIPISVFEDAVMRNRILTLVDKRLESGMESPELEVTVARAFDINRDDFATILNAFPKLTEEEHLEHLRSDLWS